MKRLIASFLSLSLVCGMMVVLTGCPAEKDKTTVKEKVTDAKEKEKVVDKQKDK